MLHIQNNAKYFRCAVRVQISPSGNLYDCGVARFDPLLRLLTVNQVYLVVTMDPVSESGLFSGSFSDPGSTVTVSTKPRSSKVKDSIVYDQHHYGSPFFDPLQDFVSLLQGGIHTAPPSRVFSEHNVRHHSFKGRGVAGVVDWPSDLSTAPFGQTSVNIAEWLNIDMPIRRYISSPYYVMVPPSGDPDYDYSGGQADAYDITPLFDLLSKGDNHSSYAILDHTYDSIISNFSYSCDQRLRFSFDGHTVQDSGSGYTWSHHFVYDGGTFGIINDYAGPPREVAVGHASHHYESHFIYTDNPFMQGIVGDDNPALEARIIGIPSLSNPDDGVQDSVMYQRLFFTARPFWDAVDLNLYDITALSRDSATLALNRLSSMAFEPSFGKIRAITHLQSSGKSLFAAVADGALSDAQRISLKKILGMGGGAGLVKYRTIFSDCLQLIESLEALGSLRNEPSRLYVASAEYDYPVVLGDRSCSIRVRSKAYLVLSPFRLLQILIGKQSIVILNDLLALFYSSKPLGELLLTLLQLRTFGDMLSNRMFYDLPMYFVHSYLVESQLTQADLDYTGISDIEGSPVLMTYYIRDVSQYLPVTRFSNLASFYGTDDIGNIIWTLLQHLVGVLSTDG